MFLLQAQTQGERGEGERRPGSGGKMKWQREEEQGECHYSAVFKLWLVLKFNSIIRSTGWMHGSKFWSCCCRSGQVARCMEQIQEVRQQLVNDIRTRESSGCQGSEEKKKTRLETSQQSISDLNVLSALCRFILACRNFHFLLPSLSKNIHTDRSVGWFAN